MQDKVYPSDLVALMGVCPSLRCNGCVTAHARVKYRSAGWCACFNPCTTYSAVVRRRRCSFTRVIRLRFTWLLPQPWDVGLAGVLWLISHTLPVQRSTTWLFRQDRSVGLALYHQHHWQIIHNTTTKTKMVMTVYSNSNSNMTNLIVWLIVIVMIVNMPIHLIIIFR